MLAGMWSAFSSSLGLVEISPANEWFGINDELCSEIGKTAQKRRSGGRWMGNLRFLAVKPKRFHNRQWTSHSLLQSGRPIFHWIANTFCRRTMGTLLSNACFGRVNSDDDDGALKNGSHSELNGSGTNHPIFYQADNGSNENLDRSGRRKPVKLSLPTNLELKIYL